MGATPQFKVFTPDGEYVASCKYAEDAAAIIAAYSGGTIRLGHNKRSTVFTNGECGVEAGESYDAVAKIVHSKVEEIAEKWRTVARLRKAEGGEA